MKKAFLLDVQKTEDDRYRGNIHDLCLDHKCSFEGMDNAFLLMDQAMDFNEDREKILKIWCYMPFNLKDSSRYHIRVLYREQNTWQGEVTWVKTGEKKRFRSALELLHLVSGTIKELEKE